MFPSQTRRQGNSPPKCFLIAVGQWTLVSGDSGAKYPSLLDPRGSSQDNDINLAIPEYKGTRVVALPCLHGTFGTM